MNRRSFIKNTGAAGLASTVPSSIIPSATTAAPFKLLYAPHFGMFENSAGKDLVDQVQFMYDEGFRALEDNGMMGRDIATQEAIGNRMAKLGMQMGVFVVNFDPWPPKTNLASGVWNGVRNF
jgi:hydroxypyruvate isomerase